MRGVPRSRQPVRHITSFCAIFRFDAIIIYSVSHCLAKHCVGLWPSLHCVVLRRIASIRRRGTARTGKPPPGIRSTDQTCLAPLLQGLQLRLDRRSG